MSAFESLVHEHTPSVYRVARALVGPAAAPDVVQEVFLAAWRELPRLREAARFRPWLHRIAVNRCRSLVRSPAHVREIPVDESMERTAPARGDDFLRAEARATVAPAFRRLQQ